jgi:hypothetical protein
MMKLEWGNRAHIQLARNHDLRMRGIESCKHRAGVSYCRIEFIDDHYGTPLFNRTNIVTRHKHAVIECPRCIKDTEVCFSDEFANSYEWEWCVCGLEFELRKDFCPYQQKEIEKVFVKQEGIS